eukprot:1158335-Pelagomonas_calceolata.AAC.19
MRRPSWLRGSDLLSYLVQAPWEQLRGIPVPLPCVLRINCNLSPAAFSAGGLVEPDSQCLSLCGLPEAFRGFCSCNYEQVSRHVVGQVPVV